MSNDSAIEWTDATWSPTTGCDRVSDGCTNCYALTLAKRLKAMGSAKYQRDGDPRTSGPGFGLTVHEDALILPLRWRKPRRVFVNSMSDLFHADVPDRFAARVFAVMAATPRHTYQILTKRHGRMRSLLSSDRFRQTVQRMIPHVGDNPYLTKYFKEWPLPNVHLGISAEDQKHADLRIPALLDTPAAVRFISAEPLLGPVDLSGYLPRPADAVRYGIECRHGYDSCPICDRTVAAPDAISWLICGGESGSDSRPMELDWVRSLVSQCQNAAVPVFVKQDSGPRPGMQGRIPDELWLKEFPVAAS